MLASDPVPILNQIQADSGIPVRFSASSSCSRGQNQLDAPAMVRPIKPASMDLTVVDIAVGIDPRNAHQLFNAFFITKPTRMGLGLSMHCATRRRHRQRGPQARDPVIVPSCANSGEMQTF